MPTSEAIITTQDQRQLEEMIQSLRTIGDPYGPYLDALQRRLNRATIVDEADVDSRIVTMHSTLSIRDASGGRAQRMKLVYAHEANPLASDLSVLTNLGTALLGSRAGDLVEWWAYRGKTAVWLDDVEQPQADAGRLVALGKE